MKVYRSALFVVTAFLVSSMARAQDSAAPPPPVHPIVLHAARLFEVESGRIVSPGEILVEGERITAAGTSVKHPAGAEVIDLGDTTLMPGFMDVHVHLFLHPGAEDMQTIQESESQRTILATLAAKDDLMAGFTAERDMGTEGVGAASSAVRDAIDKGLIPGPRLRVSANAISILGGHEDAIHYNPAQHVMSNADYANNADQLVAVMRQQKKDGADFFKIYETGADSFRDGEFHTPYQYSLEELKAAVAEAARMGTTIGVHATGEPGTLYAAEAGVAAIDHASQLSDQTMQLMKEKHIPAVPTFAVSEYNTAHAANPQAAARGQAMLDYKIREFKKQLAAGVPIGVGTDVGPFPHGTQALEMVLLVKHGMTPVAALQADYINDAKIMRWDGQIGQLKQGYYADIVAVPGNPLNDISVVQHVSFVMKGGKVYRK
jgi:imidazolonepropionase-like amidohydrolase